MRGSAKRARAGCARTPEFDDQGVRLARLRASVIGPNDRPVEQRRRSMFFAPELLRRLESCAQEAGQMPAIHVFVRCLAHRVVAAREHDHLVVEFMAGKLGDNLF